MFQSDLPPLLLPFLGNYEVFLNSEDVYNPELPLEKVRPHGGTMVMWHQSLSSFITVLPSESPSYQSILLKHYPLLSYSPLSPNCRKRGRILFLLG